MKYVDVFAAAVPVANKEAYLAHAKRCDRIFQDHGALAVMECWGDDIPDGQLTSFPMAVKKGDDEAVVVGWVVWPSKDIRDAAWGKIMQGGEMDMEMPFDGKRLIHGGFETILEV